MTCEQARAFIGDLVDDYLSEAQAALINAHIEQCPACKQSLIEERYLRQQLREVHAPPPRPAFVDAALAHARRRQRPWISGALAAALVLVMLGALLNNVGNRWSTHTQDVTMALGETRTVNMVFNAPMDLNDVAFTVVLPDAVELVGYPGDRRISWQGSLHAGENLLPLPIVARRQTSGALFTYLEYNNDTKTFKVWLSVKKQDLT